MGTRPRLATTLLVLSNALLCLAETDAPPARDEPTYPRWLELSERLYGPGVPPHRLPERRRGRPATYIRPMTEIDVPVRVDVATLGEAWLAIATAILTDGVAGNWDGAPLIEVFRATLDVRSPSVDDPIIAGHADPERLAWMHTNFTDHSRVTDLGDADSYATRLYDYAHSGRDQIRWVIDKLAADPWARNATITTFQPLTDTSYVPCVSLLDFWLVDGRLQLAVYAHAIDFGTKGYANLIELAALQDRVARELDAGIGTLAMTVKSAHIYHTELDLMRGITDPSGSR